MGTDEGRSFVIRGATLADADEITQLYLASRKRQVAFAPLAHRDAEVGRWIRGLLRSKSQVLVAEEAGEIVAMMAVATSDGSWIEQLYVHPDRLGRGHGSKLIAWAKSNLKPPIQLYTFQANTRARRFFEYHGFVAVRLSDGSTNEERCPDVLYQTSG